MPSAFEHGPTLTVVASPTANAGVIWSAANNLGQSTVLLGTGTIGVSGDADLLTLTANNLVLAGQIKITGGSPGADKVLTSNGAGLATWEAAAAGSVNSKVQPFSRSASAGAGAQPFDNAGFTPTAIMIFAVESSGSYDCASWGFGDVAGGEGCFEVRDLKGTGAQASSRDGALIFIGDGTNVMSAVLTSLDSAGCTITWTKTASGLDVAGQILYLR